MLTQELFPLPEGPTSAVTLPGCRVKDTFCNTDGRMCSGAGLHQGPGAVAWALHRRGDQKMAKEIPPNQPFWCAALAISPPKDLTVFFSQFPLRKHKASTFCYEFSCLCSRTSKKLQSNQPLCLLTLPHDLSLSHVEAAWDSLAQSPAPCWRV